MRPGNNRSKGVLRHTASQLAEMGYCECKVVLQHRFGMRTSVLRQRAQARGTAEHRRYLDEAFVVSLEVTSDHPPPPPQRADRMPTWRLDILTRLLKLVETIRDWR